VRVFPSLAVEGRTVIKSAVIDERPSVTRERLLVLFGLINNSRALGRFMSPVPVATWLPDLRALAWLVALAREVIRPVYDHLARDTRLVPPGRRPRALDHVTRDAVAWVVSSAYGLSARQAADMSPNNSRGPLARSERANVNLNDIRSCDALTSNPLTGHGSRPLTFVVPPAGFQANPIARAASKAVAGANSGPTLQVELPTTGAAPVRFTGFPRDPDDGNWEPDTLAEVVLPVALGAIRAVTGDQNRVNTAYVALNPFLVVATGDPPEPLECARREFFQKWDEAVRPHLDPRSSFDSPDELTRAWTRAEEFWGANRWPGRDHPRPRRGQPDSPLRRWLRMVLFLGADRTYGGHEIPIQRDLGRSLVFQVLGFQERPRVKCRVCGAGAPHGGGEHQCPGLSGIQREPVFDDHYEIDHEDRDSGKVPYATCRRKRPEPADAVVLLRAPAAPDWTDAAPAGAGAIELTNAAGEPFGLGLHPPVPVRRVRRARTRRRSHSRPNHSRSGLRRTGGGRNVPVRPRCRARAARVARCQGQSQRPLRGFRATPLRAPNHRPPGDRAAGGRDPLPGCVRGLWPPLALGARPRREMESGHLPPVWWPGEQ
jgi:hypothetical protein